jgi:DNA-binding transcriptional LysR family regulator
MHALPTALLPSLHALLDTESVTLAAARMHVGQPAMSRTLEKLREATGDALLVRAGKRLVRTQRADALLPELEQLLASAQRVLSPPARFSPASARGVITLALGDDLQAALSPSLLGALREEAPGLDVRVRPLSLRSAEEAVRGHVDVAVFPDLGRALPGLSELVLSPVYTRRFVAVTRRRRRLDLAAFVRAEHVLVSPEGKEGGYVDDALAVLGHSRRVAVAVPSFLAAIALVERTELVSTLPGEVVRALAPRLHRAPCPVPTPELRMCVAWAARFTSDPRQRWLRERVTRAVRELGIERKGGAVTGRAGRAPRGG